jgi:hypothetical protein
MARPTLRRVHNEGRDAWELFAPGTMATWSALSDD